MTTDPTAWAEAVAAFTDQPPPDTGRLDAEPTLFPVPPPAPKLSAGQRLTKRNADLLAKGKHPATLLPLLGSEQTCGDCAHHHHYTHRAGNYHKCDLHRLGESHSAASDVRVGWPACVRFEATA